MADLKVVTLNESNFRDPVAGLRSLADQVENGEFGEVGQIGIVLLGDQMEIFGYGSDCEAPSIALMFQAAVLRFATTIEQHGK